MCVFRIDLSRFLVSGVPGRLAKASTTAVVVPGIPAQHMSKTWTETLGGLKVVVCLFSIFISLWDIQRNPRQLEKDTSIECIHAYRCLHATGGLF